MSKIVPFQQIFNMKINKTFYILLFVLFFRPFTFHVLNSHNIASSYCSEMQTHGGMMQL